MEWQNIFPEKNQECCFPTVRCIHWIWQWMIWSRHQTREGCNSRDQLITYSPKWNTVSDELKERIAPDTPWFCVLCPTRWTVHAKSLKSVEDNYAILQKRVVAMTTKQCLESSLLPIYSNTCSCCSLLCTQTLMCTFCPSIVATSTKTHLRRVSLIWHVVDRH